MAEGLQAERGSVMLVGHLPFLSRLASFLLTGDPEAGVIRLQMAGIVCLSNQEGRWAVTWVVPPALVGVG